jgi:nitrate reductase assembly molybdenum cofactor insertion protein NarJ
VEAGGGLRLPGRAGAALEVLAGEAPVLAKACAGLAAGGAGLEEAYAQAFDWSEDRSLDLGWHLYGERYERGAFLVSMRARLRAAGVEEGEELLDHLTSLLRTLGRMEEAEARAFCAAILAPGLRKLVAGFERAEAGPYRAPLVALLAIVAEAGEAAAPDVALASGASAPKAHPTGGVP